MTEISKTDKFLNKYSPWFAHFVGLIMLVICIKFCPPSRIFVISYFIGIIIIQILIHLHKNRYK